MAEAHPDRGFGYAVGFAGHIATEGKEGALPIGRNIGDIDKLCRGVLDALTGVVFADDAQVVRLTAGKNYGGDSHTHVVARVLPTT